jgi:hypothetical protein
MVHCDGMQLPLPLEAAMTNKQVTAWLCRTSNSRPPVVPELCLLLDRHLNTKVAVTLIIAHLFESLQHNNSNNSIETVSPAWLLSHGHLYVSPATTITHARPCCATSLHLQVHEFATATAVHIP